MKKIISIAAFFMTTVLVNAQVSKNFIDQPYIEVNGSADTFITPNEIFVDIVISESDTRDRKSIEQQEKTLITALKAIEIDTDKDLVVKNFSSRYDIIGLATKVVKTKTYQVKVTNGLILSKLFNALEANKISNAAVFKISHTDIENIKMHCRTNAVKNAGEKARMLTSPLGQTPGKAIYISNYSGGTDAVYKSDNNSYSHKKAMKTGSGSSDFAEIEFERIRIEENVEVKFVLNDK